MITIQTYFEKDPLQFDFWQLEDKQDVLEIYDHMLSIIVVGTDVSDDDGKLCMEIVNNIEFDLGPACMQYDQAWNEIHGAVIKYFEGRKVEIS